MRRLQRSSDSDDESVALPAERAYPREGRRVLYVKASLAAVHTLSAIGQIVLAAVTSTFEFRAPIVALLRRGPVDASQTPGLVLADVGTVDVAVLFGVANAFCALGYLFSAFFHAQEMLFIERGVMPFLWLSLLFSNVPLAAGVELVAGLADWVGLVALAALCACWLFIYWIGTFLNSYAHIDATRGRRLSFAFLVMALAPYVAVQIAIYVAAGAKYQNGGPAAHLAPPIAATVLSALTPMALVLWYVLPSAASGHTALGILYGLNSLYVLVVSWLGCAVFATDGISYS